MKQKASDEIKCVYDSVAGADLARLLDQVRALIDRFECGEIEPAAVPVPTERTPDSDSLDHIERLLFRTNTDSDTDADRAVTRRIWGAYRLSRYLNKDDKLSVLLAIDQAVGVLIDHPLLFRLRTVRELLGPEIHGPLVFH